MVNFYNSVVRITIHFSLKPVIEMNGVYFVFTQLYHVITGGKHSETCVEKVNCLDPVDVPDKKVKVLAIYLHIK